MDRFFGLDHPTLNEKGLALLATLYDDLLVQMYEALLREEQIPYLKKDRSGGSAIRILMGNNPYGTDIYVPEDFLDRAKDLIAVDEDAVNDDDVDATANENTDQRSEI